MGRTFGDYVYSAKKFMVDATSEAMQKRDDELIASVMRDGETILVEALLETKADGDDIVRLLEKYYNMTEAEAEQLMLFEMNVDIPCQNLEKYLVRSENYTRNEAHQYICDLQVPSLLETEKELRKLAPKDLLAKVKKMIK